MDDQKQIQHPRSVEKTKLPNLSDLSDRELQDLIQQNFIANESVSIDCGASLYLKWVVSPPDRVHATSPSKLTGPHRPGGSFSFSVQLVAKKDDSFIPCNANEDIVLCVRVFGRSKSKSKEENTSTKNLVLLENNPIGKPLLVNESSPSPVITAVIGKGESIASFSGLSVTCGSNPARSKIAPEAARDWDWDYFLKIEVQDGYGPVVEPIISHHITTDSNRSQTREKRKRPATCNDYSMFPPCKKQATNFPIAPYFGIFQPHPTVQAVPTPFGFSGSYGLPSLPNKLSI